MVGRRAFIASAGAALAAPAAPAQTQADPAGGFAPVVRRKLLPDPVVVESLDLFERGGDWFVRARSEDGAEGWSVGHPGVSALSHPVFTGKVAPSFAGQDARDRGLVQGISQEVVLTAP